MLPDEGELPILKDQVPQFLYLLCEVAGSFDAAVLAEPIGATPAEFAAYRKLISQVHP